MRKKQSHSDGMKVQGFFRVNITEDGKGVIGDSGWCHNQVTNLGIRQFIVGWLVSGTGKQITHMQLGTGGAPASNADSLSGEITGTAGGGRAAVSTSVVASGTAQFTAAFASSNSFVTKTEAISNIGLFNTSEIGVGTLFAGNTFASSNCATNQSVNAWNKILGTSISNSRKKTLQIRLNSLLKRDNPEPTPYFNYGKCVTTRGRAPIYDRMKV